MTDLPRRQSRLQRFRGAYPRVDYYPDGPAHQAIERLRQLQPARSTRELIDALVCAGAEALLPPAPGVSGNMPADGAANSRSTDTARREQDSRP